MKLTKNKLNEIVQETLNEMALKIVKFSPKEMMNLHQTGQVNKDGVFYQFEEPVTEAGPYGSKKHTHMKWRDDMLKKRDSKDKIKKDIAQQVADIEKQKNISQEDREKLEKLAKMLEKEKKKNESIEEDKGGILPFVKKDWPLVGFLGDPGHIQYQAGDDLRKIWKWMNKNKTDSGKILPYPKGGGNLETPVAVQKERKISKYKQMLGINEGKKIIVKSIPGRKIQLDLENEAQA
mgnify:CR=1 FL=1